jgi:HlyD family secretion protein
LRHKLDQAQRDLNRLRGVSGTVSKQETEQQELLLLQAKMQWQAAKAKQDKLAKSQELDYEAAKAKLTASQAALASARAEVPIETLKGQLKLAEDRRNDAIVRAPIDGTILKMLAHRGELVGAQQPILQMANTDKMVVIAEVYETDIQKVHKGQTVTIDSQALKNTPLTGTVEEIGKMVGRNRVFDSDPRADVDRRVFEVRISLNENPLAARMINHQVNVHIAMDAAP